MRIVMVALLMGLGSHACVGSEDIGSAEQAEIIEVHGCRPGTLGNGEICIDPLEGGGDGGGGGGGPTGGEGGPSGPGGGGVPVIRMDPEPDRNKDRNSCHDWCDWNMRQCLKECKHRYPDPFRDIGARNHCITACKEADDPDRGYKRCNADCNARFPERPITTASP